MSLANSWQTRKFKSTVNREENDRENLYDDDDDATATLIYIYTLYLNHNPWTHKHC